MGPAPELTARPQGPRLELYWIPLGAGARVVRLSGKCFEAVSALAHGRSRCALYHSALIATTAAGRTVIEMAPTPDRHGRRDRGVVAEGAVGAGWLRSLRIFRYEIRRWPAGDIPDLAYAVASPVPISHHPDDIRRALALVAEVPTPVWGRDEFGAGEMWNSNSVVSWILTEAGLLTAAGRPPAGGRAPGWDAGIRASRALRNEVSGSRASPRGRSGRTRRSGR